MTGFHSSFNDGLRAYGAQAAATALLSRKEELELARRVQRGDAAARDHLIRANLLLVIKIAGQYSKCSVPVEDLVAEGNIGLVKAVDRYDPKKGGKFSSYAAWWIKNRIQTALSEQGWAVRLPASIGPAVSKLRKAVAALEVELGRVPTNEEISEATGIPLKKLFILQSAAAGTKSIHAPLGTDPDSGTLEENLADREALSPGELFDRASAAEDLDAALARLPVSHAELIRYRFGLGGKSPMTLRAYGQKRGITGERVRQIEFHAIRNLREMLNSKLPMQTPLPEPRLAAPGRRESKQRTVSFPRELAVQRAA